jgi:hypothetical protein
MKAMSDVALWIGLYRLTHVLCLSFQNCCPSSLIQTHLLGVWASPRAALARDTCQHQHLAVFVYLNYKRIDRKIWIVFQKQKWIALQEQPQKSSCQAVPAGFYPQSFGKFDLIRPNFSKPLQ